MNLLRLLLLLALSLPLSGRAALVWETRKIDLQAEAGNGRVTAQFPFRNEGKTVVTLTQIQPDCSCTTAESNQRSYAPGEAGVLTAVFSLDGRTGLQMKHILVTTDSTPSVSLALNVDIVETVTCTPRLLVWPKGGAPVEQSTTITTSLSARIISVEITEPRLEAVSTRIETVEAGRSYRLVVRPLALDKIANAPLHARVKFEDGKSRPVLVYILRR